MLSRRRRPDNRGCERLRRCVRRLQLPFLQRQSEGAQAAAIGLFITRARGQPSAERRAAGNATPDHNREGDRGLTPGGQRAQPRRLGVADVAPAGILARRRGDAMTRAPNTASGLIFMGDTTGAFAGPLRGELISRAPTGWLEMAVLPIAGLAIRGMRTRLVRAKP